MGRCLHLQDSCTCLGLSLDLSHVILLFLARLTATVFLVRVTSTLATFASHPQQDGWMGCSQLAALLDFHCFSSHYGMSLVNKQSQMTGADVLCNNCLRRRAEVAQASVREYECVRLTSGFWCGCVQIVRLDRTMEQIVFPVPNICEFLTQESKLRVYYTTERDEQGSKINDFFLRSEDLFNEMNWQKKLRGTQEATGNTNTVPCAYFSSTFYHFFCPQDLHTLRLHRSRLLRKNISASGHWLHYVISISSNDNTSSVALLPFTWHVQSNVTLKHRCQTIISRHIVVLTAQIFHDKTNSS